MVQGADRRKRGTTVAPESSRMPGNYLFCRKSRTLHAACILGAVACLTSCGGSNSDPLLDPGQPAAAGDPPPTGARSDGCLAMRAKLNWDYAQVRQCAADQDCNYIDGYFSVRNRKVLNQPVTTTDCTTATPPLVAANGSRVADMMDRLKQDASSQGQLCAEEADPDYPCDVHIAFLPSSPPMCQQGVCS